MRWTIEHVVEAPLARVERVVLDAALPIYLPQYMPKISQVEAVSREDDGRFLRTARRFKPDIVLPSFAKGIGQERIQWIERTVWDRAAHQGTFVIEPNIPDEWKHYFSGGGVYRLEARGAQRTARILEGEMSIRVPFVGMLAERFALSMVREQFDGEARLLFDHATGAIPTCTAA